VTVERPEVEPLTSKSLLQHSTYSTAAPHKSECNNRKLIHCKFWVQLKWYPRGCICPQQLFQTSKVY